VVFCLALLIVYVIFAVFIFSRLMFILKTLIRELSERGITLKKSNFVLTAIADALQWPYYLIRYGAAEFFRDIW
jgi:hypothetical protein